MKNEVVAMCNSRVTVRDEYETAERAHERFKELVRVSKTGKRDTDVITVYRLQEGYPMAIEEIV